MKKIILSAFISIITVITFAQNNVGIGTNTPNASALLDVSSTTKGLLTPRMTTSQRNAIASPVKGLLVFDTDINGFWFYNGSTWVQISAAGNGSSQWTSSGQDVYNNNSGMVGIGTTSPSYKLDVAGRMRLQHAGNTAGIWLDGTSSPLRSFIGTIDNDHVGIWGSGGAGWKFSMNVNNGNVGIGTSVPTAMLDVNGSLRIRQNGATIGSTLHSADGNGNVEWVAPVAFRVKGYSFGPDIIFPNDTWTDINFGTGISYNLGSGYSSGTSEFVAPQKGIYHFTSQLYFLSLLKDCSSRLRLRRAGTVSTLASTEHFAAYTLNSQFFATFSSVLDSEVLLEAGDAVWIEGRSTDYNGTTQRRISGDGDQTWFFGRLVIPL